MQKALILALLIGAFLLPGYVTAEEPDPELPPQYECLDGGTLMEHNGNQICAVTAPFDQLYFSRGRNNELYEGNWSFVVNEANSSWTHETTTSNCIFRHAMSGGGPGDIGKPYTITISVSGRNNGQNICNDNPAAYSADVHAGPNGEGYSCPSSDAPKLESKLVLGSGLHMCWALATIAVDEPPPCDDIFGNCEEPPKCFRGGAGQQVCFEDPNDKCDVSSVNGEPVYTNCESGCGFVNDNFVCSEEPDIPNLDDCYVTTNGYACPPDVPEPDDNIDNPDKPINDMKKGDFKDVLIGVETRMDASNKLTADQIARDKENTDAITGQLAKANSYLKEIDKNAKAIADGMEGLGTDGEPAGMGDVGQYKSEINSMLGITGDESIEDLTVNEINLGQFKDDFAFSLGASNCPQPRAINMLGKTFYMDWGPFCEAFTVMGYLIMAAAYFLAAMIAFKGK